MPGTHAPRDRDERRPRWQRIGSRPIVAAALGGLALAAAGIAAIGPARTEQATYAWPPSPLPASRPASGWYSPLPLLNRVPETLSVRLPCDLAPPLPGAAPIVVATARDSRGQPALHVSQSAGVVQVAVGSRELARAPWPGSCPLRIVAADGELRVGDATVPLRLGTLDEMPVITGLFTTLDLGVGAAPEVILRTRPYATAATATQAVAAGLAVALILAFLAVAGVVRLPRMRSTGPVFRRVWAEREVSDAVVAAAVLSWWVVAPVFSDDGWVWAENLIFHSLGGITTYYDVWGVLSPIGHWLEWPRHWIVGSTSDVVVMRIPSLLAILAAWLVCRWCLHLSVGHRAPPVARWALAGAFVIGTAAWEMTLRPEPFVSLLALLTLAAVLSFVRAPSGAALAGAALCCVLAITAHPAGIVIFAPVFAALPALIAWIRATGRTAVALLGSIVFASFALGLVLFTIDADLSTRLASVEAFREADRHQESWRTEYRRYQFFDSNGGGSPVRRLSLALLVLAALAWLGRWRSRGVRVLAEPARAVALGLVLLAFVTSKWPWHFGTLAPLAAVALGAEAARLILAPAGRVRSIISLGLVVTAFVWAWQAPDGLSALDLQTFDWQRVFNNWTMLVVLGAGVATSWIWLHLRRSHRRLILPALPGVALAGAALLVVALTTIFLGIDAARAPWSLPRQNLEALAGGESCGVAHQLQGDPTVAHRLADGAPSLLAPAAALYFPCATLPDVRGGVLEVPALFAFQGDPWPITELDGPFAAVADLYPLTAIAYGPGGIAVHSVEQDVPGFTRLDARRLE